MPISISQLPQILAANTAANAKPNEQMLQAAKDSREAELRQYLQKQDQSFQQSQAASAPDLAGKAQAAKNNANLETLSNPKLRNFLRPGGKVSVGDINIGQEMKPGQLLTPAQDAAEKEAGKKIAEFEGGGKAAAESNLGQLQGVQNELEAGKRDQYDQRVGGLLENHPTLMSIFAPTEKARRDSVQNAMLSMLHDAGIPRPTQWDIQRVFGQVYDSAADDKTNTARLVQAVGKIAGHKQAQEAQAKQYHQTGYATIGGPGQPQGGSAPSAAPQQPQGPLSFDEWKKANGR